MVPPAQPRSREHPIIKEPVWTWEIPFYFYSGGLAGGSAGLAFLAERRGNKVLAQRAWAAALFGVTASPALLIMDLGKPSRFLNMLRLFKVTSPMSVGSWLLSASSASTTIAAANSWLGLFPRSARWAKPAAAVLGLPLSTYTAALIANTAVPVWHEGRYALPFIFAGGAAASAGAAATAMTPARRAAPARRLAIAGAAVEIAAIQLMEKSVGEEAEAYKHGPAGVLTRLAKVCTIGGAALIAARARRQRHAALAGPALLSAGAVLERWSVVRAGFRSARQPELTVDPQRRRVREGHGHGASRHAGEASSDPDPDKGSPARSLHSGPLEE